MLSISFFDAIHFLFPYIQTGIPCHYGKADRPLRSNRYNWTACPHTVIESLLFEGLIFYQNLARRCDLEDAWILSSAFLV